MIAIIDYDSYLCSRNAVKSAFLRLLFLEFAFLLIIY